MAMPQYEDGISPATASILVREFGTCSECESDLDPDVKDALYEDRDVIWDNGIHHRCSAHTCENCGAELEVFVEEKAFGVIGESQLPDNAEEMDDIYFVPVEGVPNYLVINTHQIMISKSRRKATV